MLSYFIIGKNERVYQYNAYGLISSLLTSWNVPKKGYFRGEIDYYVFIVVLGFVVKIL